MRPLIGKEGADLSGVESRILRAALNLERRHVVAMANALPVGDEPVTLERLTQWERSKGRGYPLALVDALNALDAGVERLAAEMAFDADHAVQLMERNYAGAGVAAHPTAVLAVLRRPLGGRRTVELLSLPLHGLVLSEFQVNIMEQDSQDFWQVITDVVIARAARRLHPRTVRVVLDREPD